MTATVGLSAFGVAHDLGAKSQVAARYDIVQSAAPANSSYRLAVKFEGG